jgi:hypothetical protein
MWLPNWCNISYVMEEYMSIYDIFELLVDVFIDANSRKPSQSESRYLSKRGYIETLLMMSSRHYIYVDSAVMSIQKESLLV